MTIQEWSESQKKWLCVWFKGASQDRGYFTEASLQPYIAPQK